MWHHHCLFRKASLSAETLNANNASKRKTTHPSVGDPQVPEFSTDLFVVTNIYSCRVNLASRSSVCSHPISPALRHLLARCVVGAALCSPPLNPHTPARSGCRAPREGLQEPASRQEPSSEPARLLL